MPASPPLDLDEPRFREAFYGPDADPADGPAAAFREDEARDSHGRWRHWSEAASSRRPRFYHGTSTGQGETIGGGRYSYFTHSYYQAAAFARRRAQLAGGRPRVYPVEPTGPYGDDPGTLEGLRSAAPLRVTGRAYATPSAAEMRQLAETYHAPEPDHGPLYIGRDKDYARDQEAFDTEAAAQPEADGGTTAAQAAGAIAYAGDQAASAVWERLHAAYPAGYRGAENDGAPGRDADLTPAQLRTPMRQPYPELVDGRRAELRSGTGFGRSLAVPHQGVHVLVDGTHRAVARVLEGHRTVPVRVLDLP